MSVFVVSTAVAAAGFTAAFEVGRVCEKRFSGSSKLALPFDGFDWRSDDAKLAAKVFGALFFAETTFLPRSLNPFSYVLLPSSDAGASAILAFFVLGSWTGLLALGYGAVAASLQGLRLERRAIETDKIHQEQAWARLEEELRGEAEKIDKQKRQALASSAAVAGEWKKLHIAREEHNAHMERSENEKIWSKTIRQEFDQKTLHVVDNALDKRWRDVEDQRLNLEQIRKRNKEKEKKIKEQRAQRAERASSQQDTLKDEKANLLKLAKELEDLKDNMERLKGENMKKEQEKLKELKDREISLKQKEEDLEQLHHRKLERLNKQERTLTEREERFESGEERRKLQELSEKLESSKLNVAKFNETVMMKERQKLDEFHKRELELRQREEEFSRKAEVIARVDGASIMASYPDLEPYDSIEEMPDDEASHSQHSRSIASFHKPAEEERPNDKMKTTEIREEPSDKIESTANDLSTIREDDTPKDAMETRESQSGEGDEILAINQTIDTDEKSISMRLLAERAIATMSTDREMDSSASDLTNIRDDATSADDDNNQTNDSEQDIITLSSEEQKNSSSNKDLPIIEEDAAPAVVELGLELDTQEEEIAAVDSPPLAEEYEKVTTKTSGESLHRNSSVEDSVGLDLSGKDLPVPFSDLEEEKEEEVVSKKEIEATINDEPEESSYKSLLDDLEEDDDNESTASSDILNTNDDNEGVAMVIEKDFLAALNQDNIGEDDDESTGSSCLLNANDDRNTVNTGSLADRSNDDDEEDDNSAASTNMFNVHTNYAAVMGQLAPQFPIVQEREACNADGQQPLYYDSDEDSLFHQIQSDIAENERTEALDVECPSAETAGESLEEDVSPVSSPLQERSDNRVAPLSSAESKKEDIISENIPTSPTSDTGSLSFKDAVISMIDSNTTTADSYGDALSVAATASDTEYVFAEKENGSIRTRSIGIYENNKKITSVTHKTQGDKLVVSEDGGVELIAWSERSIVS